MSRIVFILILLVLGAELGKLAHVLSGRRYLAYVAAIVPAAAFGLLGSAFAIGFARMDASHWQFGLMATVMSLLCMPFSMLGAFLATRPNKPCPPR